MSCSRIQHSGFSESRTSDLLIPKSKYDQEIPQSHSKPTHGTLRKSHKSKTLPLPQKIACLCYYVNNTDTDQLINFACNSASRRFFFKVKQFPKNLTYSEIPSGCQTVWTQISSLFFKNPFRNAITVSNNLDQNQA